MQVKMQIFGRAVEINTKFLSLAPLSTSGSWWPIVRESFTGAWQRDVEVQASSVLAYSAVYACVRLIAGDVSKLCLRLVEKDGNDVWSEIESASFSPVLRKPNRYQNTGRFIEQWVVSKLTRGNTYVLKQRDRRGVVTAMYVLDPTRVTPLVTPDGAVYYDVRRDDLSGLTQESITVPASEIIHDVMCALYHPLIGVTPIYACGTAALQGLSIQGGSHKFFSNGSNPSGFLSAPGAISDETAARLKAYFDTNFSGDNVGKVAVGGDGLKYEPFSMSAVDAQLIEQLRFSAETVCSCFGVPPYLISMGTAPPYGNPEAIIQQYYSQCLQKMLRSIEDCLDEGLGISERIDGKQYGTEFDIDDLIWMDTVARGKAATDSVGTLSPNEARFRYYNAKPVQGGESPMAQQQYYSLQALAERDANQPFVKPVASSTPVAADVTPAPEKMDAASFAEAVRRKAIAHGLYAAA